MKMNLVKTLGSVRSGLFCSLNMQVIVIQIDVLNFIQMVVTPLRD